MSLDQKIDKVLEGQSENRERLARIETDLRHHIKRSDKHESLIHKLWFAVALLAGAGAGNAGPGIIKWLGGLL